MDINQSSIRTIRITQYPPLDEFLEIEADRLISLMGSHPTNIPHPSSL